MNHLHSLAITTGGLWLGASLWMHWGGEKSVLWMALIPAVYICLLQLLRE